MNNQNPAASSCSAKENHIIGLIGFMLLFLGFMLMSGRGSGDSTVFNSESFNFHCIRLALTLIIVGFAVQLFAIFSPANPEDI
ncbi:MAG: DUF3098 domain-containing protein [Lentisphaeria bacterium]